MDEQEIFWKNEFGDEYTDRNNENIEKIENNINFFSKILKNISISNIFEIGCNRGLNLEAINIINEKIELNGIEINEKAYKMLLEKKLCSQLFNNSVYNLQIKNKYDLVFTKGVLIHINPEKLQDVYEKMYTLSNKYILVAEYYSRDVREINYRGNTNKLYKRDFCGEIMDKYKDLKLIDYGFVYYRDSNYPLDDITWFLLEK